VTIGDACAVAANMRICAECLFQVFLFNACVVVAAGNARAALQWSLQAERGAVQATPGWRGCENFSRGLLTVKKP
jgi:hypothetical protein